MNKELAQGCAPGEQPTEGKDGPIPQTLGAPIWAGDGLGASAFTVLPWGLLQTLMSV